MSPLLTCQQDIYDTLTRRKLATAVLRDKRGATSVQYQLSVISDCLIVASNNNNNDLEYRLGLWETTLKLCLRAPDESLTDLLPQVLSDIVDELERSFDSETIRQYRLRMLRLVGQAILLRPGPDFDKQWPRATKLSTRALEETTIKPDEISAILLMVLSIISKARSSVANVAPTLLPIIIKCLRQTALESSTIIFGVKLLAVFPACMTPHTSAAIDVVNQLSRTAHFLDDLVVETCLQFLAALSEHVHLYGHEQTIRSLLKRVGSNDNTDPLVKRVGICQRAATRS